MLELNKNTYVDIEYADAYVSSHYLSTDNIRLKWDETTEDDKAILLINACQNIETLKFVGRKYDKNQTLSFPRNSSNITPIEVKHAQIEEAISFFKNDDAWVAHTNGLKSESIDGINKVYNTELLQTRKLKSVKAHELLRGWFHGCFKIS